MNHNIYYISLGCDKNRVDAEIMSYALAVAGYGFTDDLSQADIAIINTCGFIESSKVEAIDAIFDMVREKESGHLQKILVTGCLAERNGRELMEEIPEVDAVVGIGQNGDIVSIVQDTMDGKAHQWERCPNQLPLEGKRLISTPQHYAFLKIAEGCSNHCTYCAIPGIRGGYRSRPMENILSEAKELVSYGVRELILVAQDTTTYGTDLANPTTLAKLLHELGQIEGLWKIRILYAYPEHITQELIDEIVSNPKVAHYLDIPLQHASDTVLKRMGRFGSGKENLKLLQSLQEQIPNLTLRSTFIVGFSGETEEEFQELLDFIEQAQIDKAGAFIFSPEEGTPASRMKDFIDEKVQKERYDRFYELQYAIAKDKQASRIGTTIEAICDGYEEGKNAFLLRSDADAPEDDYNDLVPLQEDLIPGELYHLIPTKLDGLDLWCELQRKDDE